MNQVNPPIPDPNEQDAALSRRLARLGRKPLATANLERRLDAAFAAHDDKPLVPPPVYRLSRWLQPAAGLAAMLALVVTFFFVFSTTPPTASAAVVDLAELHHHVEEGRYALPTASSMAAVNRSLAEQRDGRTLLPESMQGVRVQSCCLHDVQGDLVALAVLDDAPGQPPVSLVVARAPDFAHEMGTVIEIDGRRFFGHELNGVRMMMANTGERWLCVMGDRSYEGLALIASEARF